MAYDPEELAQGILEMFEEAGRERKLGRSLIREGAAFSGFLGGKDRACQDTSCPRCGESFESIEVMVEHCRSHPPKAFVWTFKNERQVRANFVCCVVCGRAFHGLQGLNGHFFQCHVSVGRRDYHSSGGGRARGQKSLVYAPKFAPLPRPFVCECGMAFGSERGLVAHKPLAHPEQYTRMVAGRR